MLESESSNNEPSAKEAVEEKPEESPEPVQETV